MGISINGYIEIRHTFMLQLKGEARWYGVVNLDELLGPRDYFMFHSLFGIRDDTDFEPVAPDRGLPEDASDAVLAALEELNEDPAGGDLYGFGHTWVTFAELQAVDWEETALTGLALEYEDGRETGRGGLYSKDLPQRRQGSEFEEEGHLWKFLRITRRESLGEGGPLLYDLMEALAKHLGAEHVRAVVWFD